VEKAGKRVRAATSMMCSVAVAVRPMEDIAVEVTRSGTSDPSWPTGRAGVISACASRRGERRDDDDDDSNKPVWPQWLWATSQGYELYSHRSINTAVGTLSGV
jgi:hypothetical protein